MHRDEAPIVGPCGADWSTMELGEARTRLCASCNKSVHDLSALDPDEARSRLASGPICIRYLHDAHGNVIFGALPEGTRIVPASSLLSRLGRQRWLRAAAVVGAALVLEACGSAPYPSDIGSPALPPDGGPDADEREPAMPGVRDGSADADDTDADDADADAGADTDAAP